MLIKASGVISTGVRLLTLGGTCHYVIGEGPISLIDGCLTAQVPALIKRLESFGFYPSDIRRIYITHLHPDRIGGIAALKRLNPLISIVGTPQMKALLMDGNRLSEIYEKDIELSEQFLNLKGQWEVIPFDQFVSTIKIDSTIRIGDQLKISEEQTARIIPLPGHTQESICYFIQPKNILIGDDGFGYYYGTRPAGPGADYNLRKLKDGISKLIHLDIGALCLTNGGALTGNLIQKHLTDLAHNCTAVVTEAVQAMQEGISLTEIRESIWDSMYKPEIQDPCLIANTKGSFETVWNQVLEELKTPETKATGT